MVFFYLDLIYLIHILSYYFQKNKINTNKMSFMREHAYFIFLILLFDEDVPFSPKLFVILIHTIISMN